MSQLERFALSFHQDWNLLEPDFHSVARSAIRDVLPPSAKPELKRELGEFLERHQDSSPDELKRAWFRLGAQAWDRRLDIHRTLKEFHEMM
jgi:hypothetical protein